LSFGLRKAFRESEWQLDIALRLIVFFHSIFADRMKIAVNGNDRRDYVDGSDGRDGSCLSVGGVVLSTRRMSQSNVVGLLVKGDHHKAVKAGKV